MTSVRDLENQLLSTFGNAVFDFGNQWSDFGIPSPRMSLEALAGVAPELNISYAIKTLAPKGFSHDQIIVHYPAFYANMSRVISNTSSEVMQAFFIWKAATTMSPYIVSNVTDRYNALEYADTPLSPSYRNPRWQQCVDYTDNGVYWMSVNPVPAGLSWIVSRFFAERAYSRHARAFTDKILTTIQREFIERLHRKTWVSEQVKNGAEAKANKILHKIGYPDISPNVTDPLAVKEYYAGINITDSHFWNTLPLAQIRHSARLPGRS